MGLQQVADQHHTVQHNPKQEISRAFIAFFSYLVRPNNEASEIDFRETATRNSNHDRLGHNISFDDLKIRNHTSRQALLYQEAKDRLEVFTVRKISKALHLEIAGSTHSQPAISVSSVPAKRNFFLSGCVKVLRRMSTLCSIPLHVGSQISLFLMWCNLALKYRPNLKGTIETVSELELPFWSAARKHLPCKTASQNRINTFPLLGRVCIQQQKSTNTYLQWLKKERISQIRSQWKSC